MTGCVPGPPLPTALGPPWPCWAPCSPCCAAPPSPSALARGFLPHLWREHAGSIYGQHSLSLPQRQRQGAVSPCASTTTPLSTSLIAGTYTPICLVVPAPTVPGAGPCSVSSEPWPWPGWCSPWPGSPPPAGSPPASISSWAGWLWWPSSPCCACPPCRLFSGCWAAAFSTPWAACSTPSSGLAAIIPALAVTRFFHLFILWARCFTSCSCTGWSRFSETK